MSTTAMAERPAVGAIENVLINGDLSKLTPDQRATYYMHICESLGLNPLTKPFAYITLNGKLVLYALKDATEQLRKLHGVSITDVSSSQVGDVFVVSAKASDRTGRTDASTGAVAIGNLKGEALANALMKAETKAKRRVTLSICGLGMLDETEVESIPQSITIEAPKVERAPLPDGCVYLLGVTPKEYGGDVTVVDDKGEEHSYPIPDRQCVALAEQVVQEGVAATLKLVKGARDGKVKVKEIHRYAAAVAPAADNAALDAEIVAREAQVL